MRIGEAIQYNETINIDNSIHFGHKRDGPAGISKGTCGLKRGKWRRERASWSWTGSNGDTV
jgi:hypothetical protein